MTVLELLAILNRVEDKSIPIMIYHYEGGGYRGVDEVEIENTTKQLESRFGKQFLVIY